MSQPFFIRIEGSLFKDYEAVELLFITASTSFILGMSHTLFFLQFLYYCRCHFYYILTLSPLLPESFKWERNKVRNGMIISTSTNSSNIYIIKKAGGCYVTQ